jgi:hypothetical protein
LSVLGEGKHLARWGGGQRSGGVSRGWGSAGDGGKQGVGVSRGWGVNRQHKGRENLEQFRTTENLAWASSKTYSLPPDTRNI